MGDEDQYREIYRMLLLQLALHTDHVKIADLAEFVVHIQKEVVRFTAKLILHSSKVPFES